MMYCENALDGRDCITRRGAPAHPPAVDHGGAGKRLNCGADEGPDPVAVDGCGFKAGPEIQGSQLLQRSGPQTKAKETKMATNTQHQQKAEAPPPEPVKPRRIDLTPDALVNIGYVGGIRMPKPSA